jgi:hypothetical protein
MDKKWCETQEIQMKLHVFYKRKTTEMIEKLMEMKKIM